MSEPGDVDLHLVSERESLPAKIPWVFSLLGISSPLGMQVLAMTFQPGSPESSLEQHLDAAVSSESSWADNGS